MYQQVFDPVSDSLGLSAIFAVLPLLTLFVLLGASSSRPTGPG
jgi:lactate permease